MYKKAKEEHTEFFCNERIRFEFDKGIVFINVADMKRAAGSRKEIECSENMYTIVYGSKYQAIMRTFRKERKSIQAENFERFCDNIVTKYRVKKYRRECELHDLARCKALKDDIMRTKTKEEIIPELKDEIAKLQASNKMYRDDHEEACRFVESYKKELEEAKKRIEYAEYRVKCLEDHAIDMAKELEKSQSDAIRFKKKALEMKEEADAANERAMKYEKVADEATKTMRDIMRGLDAARKIVEANR